ncbi:MAG: hypothetical protein K6U80_17795 [Firmicutes bacterium]|nr:hypothetical protein [Bacillota bacterium]
MTIVTAALIVKNNQILIAQRGAEGKQALIGLNGLAVHWPCWPIMT